MLEVGAGRPYLEKELGPRKKRRRDACNYFKKWKLHARGKSKSRPRSGQPEEKGDKNALKKKPFFRMEGELGRRRGD